MYIYLATSQLTKMFPTSFNPNYSHNLFINNVL